MVMKHHNQFRISSWRLWWLLFVLFLTLEGAAQQWLYFIFLFFCMEQGKNFKQFGDGALKHQQINPDACMNNLRVYWTISHLFWFGWQREKCKWGKYPSPPSIQGKRWGKFPSLSNSSLPVPLTTKKKRRWPSLHSREKCKLVHIDKARCRSEKNEKEEIAKSGFPKRKFPNLASPFGNSLCFIVFFDFSPTQRVLSPWNGSIDSREREQDNGKHSHPCKCVLGSPCSGIYFVFLFSSKENSQSDAIQDNILRKLILIFVNKKWG